MKKAVLRKLFAEAVAGELHDMTFVDRNQDLIDREIKRLETRGSGPHAENILRDLGVVAAGSM